MITVPAPTKKSGNSLAIISIAPEAALVRNVTSAQGRPPFFNAFANGNASSTRSMTTTGIIPISENLSIIHISIYPFYKYHLLINLYI